MSRTIHPAAIERIGNGEKTTHKTHVSRHRLTGKFDSNENFIVVLNEPGYDDAGADADAYARCSA